MITREDLIESNVVSVAAFVDYLLEMEQTECTPGECQALAGILGISIPSAIALVREAGVTMKYGNRENPSRRGHSAPINGTPRFSGANSTFTTPSGSNIGGFAGTAGY